MTALAASLPISLRRHLRPWLPQALPLMEGIAWRIEPRDLAEGLALLLMFSVAFGVWKVVTP